MSIMTVEQVLNAQPGPIPGVFGRLVGVYERKTGENSRGEYSIQNITLEGATGAKLKVKLWHQPEVVKEGMGYSLYVLAGAGKSGKPVGLASELDTYKEVTSVIVSTTKLATVTFEAPTNAPALAPVAKPSVPETPTAVPTPPTRQNAPTPPPSAQGGDPFETYSTTPPAPVQPTQFQPAPPRPPSGPTAAQDWSKVDGTIAKLVALRTRSGLAAHEVARNLEAAGCVVTADHIGAIDSWMAIELCKQGMLVHIPAV